MCPVLETFPGNQHIQRLLKRMVVKGDFPQTFLFKGPKGVGKGEIARDFARAILTQETPSSDTRDLPDLFELYPEGKGDIHSMEKIKELIKNSFLPPFEGEKKIFIVHDAEKMLEASANALLKTLEEPQDHSIIILTTSFESHLLKTILSRAFIVPFLPISQEELSSYIEKTWGQTRENAKQIAILSQGNLHRVASLIDGEKGHLYSLIPQIGIFACFKEYHQLDDLLKRVSEGVEKEGIEQFYSLFFYWYRDLHLLNKGGDSSLLFFQDHKEQLEKCLQGEVPSLDIIESKMEKVRDALELNLPLSHVFSYLTMA